jgi:molybdopterin/thiamine biosynthesis adenylyltransferase
MITVVGLGALGSHVVQFLRNEPSGIHVVDFDRVESKNVGAQFHTKMGLGKNKASALDRAMEGLFGVKVARISPVKLTDCNNFALLEGSDLIIDCTDNQEARIIISEWCTDSGVPCLHG